MTKEYKFLNEGMGELMYEMLKLAKEDYVLGLMQERHPRKRQRMNLIAEKVRNGETLTNSERTYRDRYNRKRELKEDAEKFFRSEWCLALTGVDGEVIMKRLSATV